MMALPSSGRGALKAIMLSGIFLTSILQLTQAQNQLVITKEPEYPKVGQKVILIPSPVSSNITMCEWFRGSTPEYSNKIFAYSQVGETRYTSLGNAGTGRLLIHSNCNLHIRKLRPQDAGNYTFLITQKSGQKEQDGEKTLQAFTYLQIQTPVRIAITADPPFPKLGQNVTLTPQGNFTQNLSCHWTFLPVDRPGHSQRIVRQISEHEVKQNEKGNRRLIIIGDGCSLQITQLSTTDTLNYTVKITARSQEPQEPGQRVHGQGALEQEYTGHISLNIEDPHAGPEGSSASLSNSAGVIAGGLLGSLAWADSLMSLFSVLLGSFSSWRPNTLSLSVDPAVYHLSF
ncbi:uncharacterized protein [Tiliqua scincoides]|uniref:uncharacterized protein n=1 Tax=Tiliqua scincoides TaxID=71010 RepID=UPI003463672D